MFQVVFLTLIFQR